MMAGLPDDHLMRLVALDRSRAAFAEIHDRHVVAAFACSMRVCRERALAEDAVQEAFLSVWRASGRYDAERGNLRGWILAIVRNRAIDLLRRGAHDRAALTGLPLEEQLDATRQTDEEAERREHALALRRALLRLPAEQSSVIELAYYGGYTHGEISLMHGAPVGTIKGRMRLGLQRLRSELSADRAAA